MHGNGLTMLKLTKQGLKENLKKIPVANIFLTLGAVENKSTTTVCILKLRLKKFISESNLWVSLHIDAVDFPSLAD